MPFNALLSLERRLSRDGMVSVNGNEYSVPDGVRGRSVEVRMSLSDVQIFADGTLVAAHPLQEGRHQRLLSPGHRRWPPPGKVRARPDEHTTVLALPGESVLRRPLAVYDRIGAALAEGRR